MMELSELYLHGRRYTWSNECRHPTLERIDRAFATVPWLEAFPCHHLRCVSTDCSDHAPLLLDLCTEPWARPRFRFEAIWVRFDGFLEAVSSAWVCTLVNVDHCRVLDFLLRRTTRALKSWSSRHVGSVRFQLFAARELISHLNRAPDERGLTDEEHMLRKDLKRESLGLALLARTIARQRSRIRFLGEGDANTMFFSICKPVTANARTPSTHYSMVVSCSQPRRPNQNLCMSTTRRFWGSICPVHMG